MQKLSDTLQKGTALFVLISSPFLKNHQLPGCQERAYYCILIAETNEADHYVCYSVAIDSEENIHSDALF